MHGDSVDKIVKRYFACLTREPFSYKGKEYEPKPLTVSPLLLRDYTCPALCGACCSRFTLDYLPSEPQPEGLAERVVEFNGEQITIHTDPQKDSDDHFCGRLNKESGRCGIHGIHPFSCDFELIRTLESSEPGEANTLTQKLYGRGWNMLRIDGERGAMCEMKPPSEHSMDEVIRKLKRFISWARYFGLRKTWAPEIIELVEDVRDGRRTFYTATTFPKVPSKKGFGRK